MSAAISEPAALALFERIPGRPPADLDRVLDATERCLARFGLRRTSMTDIAREMSVARTTLYRQVASIEEAVALVGSRQFYRFLDEMNSLMAAGSGPDTFVAATIRAVTFGLEHPVMVRVLNDEPELIGDLITSGRIASYADQIVDLLAPLFKAAMARGSIRRGDPRLAAGVMVRLVGSLLMFPAGDDLERVVRHALEPILQPTARVRRR